MQRKRPSKEAENPFFYTDKAEKQSLLSPRTAYDYCLKWPLAAADNPAMSTLLEQSAPAQNAPASPTAAAPSASAAGQVHSSLELLSDLYNYNHWIYNKVRPFIRGKVCEVGSGIGNITQFLLGCDEVVGIEPLEQSIGLAEPRFKNHLNVRFVQGVLENFPNNQVPQDHFDTVVCMNVLEHIEDDVDSLRRMRLMCKPRGRVVILVPAHMSIYGEIDRSFGHYRRYNRKSLGRVFRAAGLNPTYSFYMNSLGYFGWLWHSRLMKREQIPGDAGRFFNRLVPFLDAFERVVRLPFGQSVIMIGTPGQTPSTKA